jgi:hypothetical protein
MRPANHGMGELVTNHEKRLKPAYLVVKVSPEVGPEDDNDRPTFLILVQGLCRNNSTEPLKEKVTVLVFAVGSLEMLLDRSDEIGSGNRYDVCRRQPKAAPHPAKDAKCKPNVVSEGVRLSS